MLWISGKPGTGKSTLMEFARRSANENTNNGDKLVLSFYFHGRGTHLQKTFIGLLRSLLHQLLMRSRSLRSRFESVFKSKQMVQGQPGLDWVWHVRELQDLLAAAFEEVVTLRDVEIFIDALDECGEDTAKKLVAYFEILTSRMTRKGTWHLCFSCRRYPVLNITGGSEICVEEENSSDISAHIWGALQNCSEIRPQLAPEIARRSSGVFQWVSLVVPLVIRLHTGGMTTNVLLARLQDVPRDLISLYREIVTDINVQDRSRALYLFQWICFCERPLEVRELRKALNSDGWAVYGSLGEKKEARQLFDSGNDDQSTAKAVNFLSGGLVEVMYWSSDDDDQYSPKDIVQLAHQSVKDFMIEEGLELLAPRSSFQIVGSAQHRLSRSCMVYAFATQAQHPNFVVPGFFQETAWGRREADENDSFYGYAIEFSMVHAEQAEKHDIAQEDILDILCPTPYESDDAFRNKRAYLTAISKRYFMDGPAEGHPPIIHIMAQFNIFSVVNRMVETTTDINERDKHGMTALHRCAENGSLEAVRFLLQHGADDSFRDNFGKVPLHRACFRSRERNVKVLSGNARSQNARDMNGLTPLHDSILAILQGDSKLCWAPTETSTALIHSTLLSEHDTRPMRNEGQELLETIKTLLRQGSKLDARDTFGRTPLHLAVTRQLEAVTRYLLALDEIDVNATDAKGYTPLLTAAQLGAFESVRLLIKQNKVDLDHKADDGRTLLSYMVEYKVYHIEGFISSLIARREVNADWADRLGRTPLSYACSHGIYGTIKILLTCDGVDPGVKDICGRTPLSYFCSRFKGLHSYQYDSFEYLKSREDHDYQEILELLFSRSKYDLELKDQRGRSLLSYAAEVGNWHLVKYLMTKDNTLCLSRDATDKTPTRWAYIGRNPDLGNWLQEKSPRHLMASSEEIGGPGQRHTRYDKRGALWFG